MQYLKNGFQEIGFAMEISVPEMLPHVQAQQFEDPNAMGQKPAIVIDECSWIPIAPKRLQSFLLRFHSYLYGQHNGLPECLLAHLWHFLSPWPML